MKWLALVLLCGCGGVALPFEGTWTGTLTRNFECIVGGSIADVPTSWVITREGDALTISTGTADCPTLTATVAREDDTLARMDAAHCATTVEEPITNTRTWTGGRLRLRSGGSDLLVDAWEHDEGQAAGAYYICDGLSYGLLLMEGQ